LQWHDASVIALARIVLLLLADLFSLALVSIRPKRAVEAENLILHRVGGEFVV
jgi:hypothetical protein